MFKLVAFLFAVANPSGPPVSAMTYNQEFPSEEVCLEFIRSEDGMNGQTAIRMVAHGNGLTVRFRCLETKDNTI